MEEKQVVPAIVRECEKAHKRGVPLVELVTADEEATISLLSAPDTGAFKVVRGEGADKQELPAPLLAWSPSGGYRPLNAEGHAALVQMLLSFADEEGTLPDPEKIVEPVGALRLLLPAPPPLTTKPKKQGQQQAGRAGCPDGTVLLAQGLLDLASREGEREAIEIIDAIKALRGRFEVHNSMLVMLTLAEGLPLALQNDVVVLEEELPTREQLASLVRDLHQWGNVPLPEDSVVGTASEILSGLSHFAAKTAVSMAFAKHNGDQHAHLDIQALRKRQRLMIGQVDGLGISDDKTRLDDIGGVDVVKGMLRRLVAAKRVSAVLFIDEIGDALAGSGTDTTGVGQDQHRHLLTWMQRRLNEDSLMALLFVGVAGTAKTALANAIGNEIDAPVIDLDLGGMEDQWVGSSQKRIRRAFRVVDAIGAGTILMIGTTNQALHLSPQLQSRFTFGRWFFDLPDKAEEAPIIWRLWRAKYGIPEGEPCPVPEDETWTGREIRQACMFAHTFSVPLAEAAPYIAPVCKADREVIDALRGYADGKLLSASYPGFYHRPQEHAAQAVGRKVRI